ncbi:MAG: DUF3644 domain-containing protein [Candidatus Limnocylindrales bacterium]
MAGPIRHALLAKSREAALTAVQTYNNPLVRFKSETFIVLMTIAWTYLMHAYYTRAEVDFRYLDKDPGSKRKYKRTPDGGYKWWELSSCIKVVECPLDRGTVNNLNFLIGLRHEIEHHRPPHLDDHMSGRYLACALNFEFYLTSFFGERLSLGESVAMALHFRDIKPTDSSDIVRLPARLSAYIEKFEGDMTQEEFDDPRFAYRLLFTRKVANRKGQADRAIEFIRPGDPGAEGIAPERWLVKDTEKPKFRAGAVVKFMQDAGYTFFGKYQHTLLWRRLEAKNPALGYGAWVANEWFWYETWIAEAMRQCQAIVDQRVAVVGPRR